MAVQSNMQSFYRLALTSSSYCFLSRPSRSISPGRLNLDCRVYSISKCHLRFCILLRRPHVRYCRQVELAIEVNLFAQFRKISFNCKTIPNPQNSSTVENLKSNLKSIPVIAFISIIVPSCLKPSSRRNPPCRSEVITW